MAITITPRPDGTLISQAEYDGDRQEIVNGMIAANVAGHSATATQMRVATDPGELGAESLPGTLDGELERLRFTILEMKQRLATGNAAGGLTIGQWYETPTMIPVGQCRLMYESPTELRLRPFQGNSIFVNHQRLRIGSSGAILSNAGLPANTTLLVFAFNDAGAAGLVTSGVAAHTNNTHDGTEILTSNPLVTLVGLCRTNASSQFDDSPTKRNVASYFNRRPRIAEIVDATQRVTGSGALVERAVGVRGEFVTWGTDVLFTTHAQATGTVQSYASIALDGAAIVALAEAPSINPSGVFFQLVMQKGLAVAEGFHTFSQMMASDGVGTTTHTASRNRTTAMTFG